MFKGSGGFLLLVLVAALPASAQIASGNGQAASSVSGVLEGSSAMDASQRNQPYTMKQQTTTLRTLADGTHITTVREETRIRDGEGRTRTEITRDGPSPLPLHFIQIFDPVAHTWTSLDDRNKVARINHMVAPRPPTPEQEARLAELRARAQAARAGQSAPDSAPGAASSPRIHRDVETLPARVIAGIPAEGKRVTRTIPAGKEGNDRDLTITTETWTSPELRVVLERTTEDPRTGKISMTTLSLERASPDPGLFQVPADYKVVDQQPAILQ